MESQYLGDLLPGYAAPSTRFPDPTLEITGPPPRSSVTDDGMVVTVTFFRLKPDPSAPCRTPMRRSWVWVQPSADRSILHFASADRVDAKAGGRYETEAAPFLIVIGMHDTFQTDNTIETALYGMETVQVPLGAVGRRNDGSFGVGPGSPTGKTRRVSADALVRDVYSWQPDKISVSVAVNPHADRPWPSRILPADRSFGEIGRTETEVQYGWTELPPDAC